MTRWEYKTELHAYMGDKTNLDSKLTALGLEGWEMVGVVQYVTKATFVAVFKRPLPEAA